MQGSSIRSLLLPLTGTALQRLFDFKWLHDLVAVPDPRLTFQGPLKSRGAASNRGVTSGGGENEQQDPRRLHAAAADATDLG